MKVGLIARLVGGFVGFGLLCAACGATTAGKDRESTVCSPGTKRCVGHEIKRCDDSGLGESVWDSCSNMECRVRNGEPFCAGTACTANLALCAGSVATKCSLDGSGPVAGGVDCAAAGQFCVEGACVDTPCVPGAKSCKDGDVYLCAADGRSLSLSRDCAGNERCSAELGTCLARICEPDTGVCFGTRAATCDSNGSGFLPAMTDCSAEGKICVDGQCQRQGCTPGSQFCASGNIYQCDANGVRGTLSKACFAGMENCVETAAGMYAFCVAKDCVAGQKVCAGDTVKICNADGQLPADGTACKDDEYCSDAQCKPRGCKLGTTFCKDNDVYDCELDGPSLRMQCDPGSACREFVAEPDTSHNAGLELTACVPYACPANTTGCALNRIGTCGSDGASLSSVTTDCATSGQVCTAAGTCAASVTDTIGRDENPQALTGSPYIGNVIDVSSARRLTLLQMGLLLPAAHDLRWMVLEQVGNQFVVRTEKTTPAASSAGFVSSGAISFQLEPGKRYALGVVVPQGGIPYTISESPLLAPNSFGQVIGAALGDVGSSTSLEVATSFNVFTAVYMKVTTELP